MSSTERDPLQIKFIDNFLISFIEPIIIVQWNHDLKDSLVQFSNVAQKNDSPPLKIISAHKLQTSTTQIVYTGCKDWVFQFNEHLKSEGFVVPSPPQVGIYLSPQTAPSNTYIDELFKFFSISDLPFEAFIKDSHGSLFIFPHEMKERLINLM